MALVLSRKTGQTLCIGDDITVTVIGIDHGQVKIAINAPKHVRVDRLEIRERILADGKREAV